MNVPGYSHSLVFSYRRRGIFIVVFTSIESSDPYIKAMFHCWKIVPDLFPQVLCPHQPGHSGMDVSRLKHAFFQ